jgi:thymidine kinase
LGVYFIRFASLQKAVESTKMFLENTLKGESHSGWIEVVTGSMFSGKTEELLRRINRAVIAKQSILIFKPAVDTRYEVDRVVSHNKNAVDSICVSSSKEILALAKDVEVVGVDEAQFFDDDIVEVCNALADSGKRVIVAGLDMDYSGKPFGPMPNLMAIAEYVTKVHAICTQTGMLANYSFRKSSSEDQIELGEKDKYEPLSRTAFVNMKGRG